MASSAEENILEAFFDCTPVPCLDHDSFSNRVQVQVRKTQVVTQNREPNENNIENAMNTLDYMAEKAHVIIHNQASSYS